MRCGEAKWNILAIFACVRAITRNETIFPIGVVLVDLASLTLSSLHATGWLESSAESGLPLYLGLVHFSG